MSTTKLRERNGIKQVSAELKPREFKRFEALRKRLRLGKKGLLVCLVDFAEAMGAVNCNGVLVAQPKRKGK